jgi:hypothetical protein
VTEILYCSKRNIIFLFEGKFNFDFKKKQLVVYLDSNGRKFRGIKPNELEHIGWL